MTTQDAHTLGEPDHELTLDKVRKDLAVHVWGGYDRAVIAFLTERLHQAERERDEARAHLEVLKDAKASWRAQVNGLTWAEVIDGLEQLAAATQRASDLERRLEAQDAALDALVDAARERSYEGHHEYCANSVEGMNGGCKCGHAELVAALDALPTTDH